MEHFLINSTACLFTLWLAYKLLLENTSWHNFKRFYLIGALIISLIIPFIVVHTIIIPMEEIPFGNYSPLVLTETMVDQPSFEINWFYVACSIYLLGVLIMLWRFSKNLYSFRIQQTDEISSYKAYQLILRNGITIPHSFLKRIFISKKDYESNKVPAVVLEHEKAHLDQRHSLDILFIELLLIVLWFNPLLYIIRYSMKLNHEFLADSAVLKQGISTTAYQEILLDHATMSYQQAMANTFTFPIIKKRFYIMKTHTSNTSLVLRSLALIPILALLVISCGKEETEFQEIEEILIVEDHSNQKFIIVDPNDPEGKIVINGEPHYYKINGDQIDIYNTLDELQDFKSQGYEIRRTDEEIEIIEILENISSKDIEEYNFQAKKHSEFIKEKGHVVVFKEDTKRMQLIFNSMSDQQKAENEPWPYLYWDNDITPGDIPPPPPPAAPSKNQGYIKVDGKIHYYTLKNNEKAFYDRWGNKIDVKGKTVEYLDQKDLPPPPPPAAASEDHGYIKVDGKIHYYTLKNDEKAFYDRWGNKIDVKDKTVEYLDQKDLPPPPPPANPMDYIKNSGDNMNYYIDDVKVNVEKAKAFIEKNGNKGIQIMPVNGVNSLKMFSKDKRVGVKDGSWDDVQKHLKSGISKNISTQKIIGDPLDVINLNREKYTYYVDGHILDYEEALLIVAKNEHWNIYTDNVSGKTSMMINTHDVIYGPEEIKNHSDC